MTWSVEDELHYERSFLTSGYTSSSGAIELAVGCRGRTTPASRICMLDTMLIRIHQEE